MTDEWARGGQAERATSKPPRSKGERKNHVLRRLESDDKLWIATASEDGSAHLVPFSFVWDGVRIVAATHTDGPAARNARRTRSARVALGDFRDVILIDGEVPVTRYDGVDPDTAQRLARVSALDGRTSPSVAYLQLTPSRVQAWWSMTELPTPTLMRDGHWLA
jgi:hypothetical protein